MKQRLLKMRAFWSVLVLLLGTPAGGILRAEPSRPRHAEGDSLPPLKDGQSLQTVAAAWAGFDPQAKPLEVEMFKEWEEEGVVIRAIRYRIGVFKGRKSWMAALYSFPKGAKDLPGIVQLHGGGGLATTREFSFRAADGVPQATFRLVNERGEELQTVGLES